MIIHAVNIHSGGGKILLDQLIIEKNFGEVTTLICDLRYRMPEGYNPGIKIIRVSPKIFSRWKAEKVLKSITDKNPGQTVLCFANLPPAFKLKAHVILYLQNALLLPDVGYYFNSFMSALKIIYERIWINIFWKNLDEVWVQTNWMKHSLSEKKKPVSVKPIFPALPPYSDSTPKKYDFICVTGSTAHKRLNNLLDAWELMPDPAPSLLVITDIRNERMDSLEKKNVTFKLNLSRAEVFQSYRESRYFILTSKIESFCLPIYEAINFRLKLICPREDYVNEFREPDLYIDPENPVQMQKDIERFYYKEKNIHVPLKILNVNMTIDPVKSGGTGERTVQMSRALSALGHTCSILTLNLGLTESRRNELKDIKLTILPCLSERYYIPYPDLFKISSKVKDSEIVHLMGHWTILNAITYFFIKRYKKKYVFCPAGALPIFGRSTGIKKIYNFIIGRRIIKNADSYLVISHEEISQFKVYGVSAEKIFWIPNGIDPAALQEKDDSHFREKYNIGSAPFIFYIGRLNPIKGPDLLLKAFCEIKDSFPEFKLVFAGPDEGMQEGLETMARDAGIKDRVHFIGHVAGNIKSQALHAATLMAIPSRLEAMSIVVLEAGVASLAVILTDKCGLNDLADIDAGIVVPATVEGIREGLVSNLHNQEKLTVMGKNLKAHVYKNYLWPSVAVTIENVYLKLVTEK